MFPTKTDYYPVLTGIRALGAYLVFFHHYYNPEDVSKGMSMVQLMIGEMHIGVTFFFVLSGFLIHNRYYNKFEKSLNGYRRFFFARIARVFPLFIVLTVVTFMVFYLKENVSNRNSFALFLLNITLLKGFSNFTKFSGIAQAWSLTIEFCFYAVAPLLFFYFKNRTIPYFKLSIILAFTGFSIAWIVGFLPFGSLIGDNSFFMLYTFLGRSFEFFAGCFLSSRIGTWKMFESHSPKYSITGFAGIVLSLFMLACLRNGEFNGILHPLGIITNNWFLPLFIVIFFRGLILERSFLSGVLSSNFFQILGKSSYAFYLIHIGIFEGGFSAVGVHHPMLLFLGFNLIAYFFYRLIEEPAQAFLVNWYSSRNGNPTKNR